MSEPVVTRLPDVGGYTLAQLAGLDLGQAVTDVTDRTDQPGASISGYNPQRLDDGEDA